MEILETGLKGVKVLIPKKIGDERGFFSETYNRMVLAEAGIEAEFVQDNQSLSRQRGVVRGMHYQSPPFAQGKLLRVLRGAVLDVVVDIRHGSPTFGHHFAVEISSDAWNQIWIDEGLAHGFCTLTPDTEVFYKVTNFYAPQSEYGIAWNDPTLGIDWPISASEAILSDRDRKQPPFADLPQHFTC